MVLQRLLTRVAGVVTVGFGTSCTALAASSGETPNFPGNGMRTMVYEGTSYPEWSRPAAVLPKLQQSLQLRANDVVVASYPKSGSESQACHPQHSHTVLLSYSTLSRMLRSRSYLISLSHCICSHTVLALTLPTVFSEFLDRESD